MGWTNKLMFNDHAQSPLFVYGAIMAYIIGLRNANLTKFCKH